MLLVNRVNSIISFHNLVMIIRNLEFSGKEKANNTVVKANNVNLRGLYSNYSQYQNGANGQRRGENIKKITFPIIPS
jgi:hypothetical protein